MSPQIYVLLAFFLVLVTGLILVLQRLDRMIAKMDASVARREAADEAMREHIKACLEKVDQRLLRMMEAQARGQQSLESHIAAQHSAIESNSRAAEHLAGAIKDLRAALIEATKL